MLEFSVGYWVCSFFCVMLGFGYLGNFRIFFVFVFMNRGGMGRVL